MMMFGQICCSNKSAPVEPLRQLTATAAMSGVGLTGIQVRCILYVQARYSHDDHAIDIYGSGASARATRRCHHLSEYTDTHTLANVLVASRQATIVWKRRGCARWLASADRSQGSLAVRSLVSPYANEQFWRLEER